MVAYPPEAAIAALETSPCISIFITHCDWIVLECVILREWEPWLFATTLLVSGTRITE